MPQHFVRLAVAAIILVACGDSTGPDNAAALAAALQQFAGAQSYLPLGLGKGGAPELPALGDLPTSCTYDANTTFFVCPKTTALTLDVNRSYQLRDADDVSLSSFDARKVESIFFLTWVTGTVSYQPTGFAPSPTTSITFASYGEHILGGLLDGGRSIVGGTLTTAASTTNGKTKTTTTTETVNDVVPSTTPGQFASAAGFPKSGSVSSIVAGTDTSGAALPVTTVVTTFNGTPTVSIKVTKDGITTTWSCDYSSWSSAGGSQIFVVCF